MRLEVREGFGCHKEMCTAVAWTPEGELYSISDDKTICKWDASGEPAGKVASIDFFATDMAWMPTVGKQAGDQLAVAAADGTIRFLSRAGREEKKVDAHAPAACTRVVWNRDGSALLSCGEDGRVRVWSRSGNLRNTLLEGGRCVLAAAWSPDGEAVAVGLGRELHVKAMQAGKKQLQWPAHTGLILSLDWNAVTGLLVSAGEDCCCRVWDPHGRQLFSSAPSSHVVTSAAWSPSGESFAVGAFNLLRVCDRTGWTQARERPQVGSVMRIAWSADGTQVAGAGGSGAVVFAQLVGRSIEWSGITAVLADAHKIRIYDSANGAGGPEGPSADGGGPGGEATEELDFPRDRVVDMALGHGHLVAVTGTQCFVYSTANWNTPHIFDVRGAVGLVLLAAKHFATVDSLQGVQIWSYEGRQISNPKFPNLRPELLSRRTVSLGPDVVAVLDRSDGRTIRLCDVATGRPLQDGVVAHDCEVLELALSNFAPGLVDRRLAFVDRNRDLWIAPVTKLPGVARGKQKLQAQVDSFQWNDASDVLVAIADGRLLTWHCPNAAYIDRSLLALSTASRAAPEMGAGARILTFYGARITVRRADGAVVEAGAAPYPAMLHALAGGGRWREALRLCRFVKSDPLWAAAAAMAIAGRELSVAEEALAAIREVDKLEYLRYVQQLPSEESRSAALAVYRRCPDEGEAVLLQASPPLVWRAVKLNVELFRWARALEIAVKHRSHVDTVLGYRQRYLERFGKTETDARFKQYADQVAVDWEAIEAKERKEEEDERARYPNGGGGGGGRYK